MTIELLIIGAGPAGMSAAIAARRYGLDVMVIDDQPTPGGQIWRSIETAARRDSLLGPAYAEGRAVAEAFRASGVRYLTGAQLWRLDPGYRAFVSVGEETQIVQANAVLLATGAQERPNPFPGWTLPGVLTVGAAQILLKSAGEVPSDPVWIAGSGPLPLLYAAQLLRAGGEIAGFLDTTPAGQWLSAVRHFPPALWAVTDLVKGLGWMAHLRRSGVPIVRHVTDLTAVGTDRIEGLRYETQSGKGALVDAKLLLVHEGVIPNIHVPLSIDCDVEWDTAQECLRPVLNEWGESSQPNLFIAGDGAGIAGAKAARLRGELTAVAIAENLGRITRQVATAAAAPIRRKLRRELAFRPFLDAMFRPRPQVFAPSDDTIICRCEAVTAAEIRSLARIGCPGPNQLKASTRAGMGPCQGRQCGYSVLRLLSAVQDRKPGDVGYLHIRPPLKPVTLGELATIKEPAE